MTFGNIKKRSLVYCRGLFSEPSQWVVVVGRVNIQNHSTFMNCSAKKVLKLFVYLFSKRSGSGQKVISYAYITVLIL